MRKMFMFCLFLAVVIMFSGCSTVKNTCQYSGKGLVSFFTDPFYGFCKGVTEDIDNTTKAVKKADDWIAENFW